MGKLDLKTAVIHKQETLDAVPKAEEILDGILDTLARTLDYHEYPRPESKPKDLAEIPDPEALTDMMLGVYLSQYTSWASFYNGQLAKIKAAEDIAELNHKTFVAKTSLELFRRPDVPKTEVATHVSANQTCRDAALEMLRLRAMKLIIEAQYKAYDKQAAAISRLITLRLGDHTNSSRGNAGAGAKRPSGPARAGGGWGSQK